MATGIFDYIKAFIFPRIGSSTSSPPNVTNAVANLLGKFDNVCSVLPIDDSPPLYECIGPAFLPY